MCCTSFQQIPTLWNITGLPGCRDSVLIACSFSNRCVLFGSEVVSGCLHSNTTNWTVCGGMYLEKILTGWPVKCIIQPLQTMIAFHTNRPTHLGNVPIRTHSSLKYQRSSPLLWYHSSVLQTCCHVGWFNDSTVCTACSCYDYILDFRRAGCCCLHRTDPFHHGKVPIRPLEIGVLKGQCAA